MINTLMEELSKMNSKVKKPILTFKDNYWTDENNNTWLAGKGSRKMIERWSKTLVNCKNCIQCLDCKNCDGCKETRDSTDCKNCNRCAYVTNCEKCENCSTCDNCTNCKNCDNSDGLKNKSNVHPTDSGSQTPYPDVNENKKGANKMIVKENEYPDFKFKESKNVTVIVKEPKKPIKELTVEGTERGIDALFSDKAEVDYSTISLPYGDLTVAHDTLSTEENVWLDEEEDYAYGTIVIFVTDDDDNGAMRSLDSTEIGQVMDYVVDNAYRELGDSKFESKAVKSKKLNEEDYEEYDDDDDEVYDDYDDDDYEAGEARFDEMIDILEPMVRKEFPGFKELYPEPSIQGGVGGMVYFLTIGDDSYTKEYDYQEHEEMLRDETAKDAAQSIFNDLVAMVAKGEKDDN